MNDTDLTHTTGTRKFFLAWKKRQNKISIISLMSSRRRGQGFKPCLRKVFFQAKKGKGL
jgi:hypothetical protein